MCGLVAVWGSGAPELATSLAKRLEHRGPDGSGTLHVSDADLTLAHRRLAIIDPAGGHQPLVSASGGATLVANGMIYNDRELRGEIGHERFLTATDSESILQSLLRHGHRAAGHLDGMFAFVAARGDAVLAARDPIGIKPLYIGRSGDSVMFASEIKAICGHAEEIHEFPPGHVFTTARGLERYYTAPPITDDLADTNAAAKAIRETLTSAVEKRLRSDVPLGVFLSGGLDSSIIAAIASSIRPGLKTFATGLAGSPDLIAARQVAAHLGTDHHEYLLDPDEIRRDLPKILYHLESFDQDLVRSAIPCYYVSRLAAEHVKVVLTGEGADELFAGYAYHKTYEDDDALQRELKRAIDAMHDINLQRVDRMTMAHGLEARVPFLDTDMLEIGFRIPVALKLPRERRIEKWVLRKTFEDLLPADIVWRTKAQFDEGSGTADFLSALPHGRTADDGRGRSDEERYYRDLLLDQFDDPDTLLPLVAHWDDSRRIDDESGAGGAVTSLGTRPDATSGVALNDFSDLYDRLDGQPYFSRMAAVDYGIPAAAHTVYDWCIGEVRSGPDEPVRILDLCAGYGINGALIKHDIDLDELYAYYTRRGAASPQAAALFDGAVLRARRRDTATHITGFDIAGNALSYGARCGYFDEGYAVNLESEPLPAAAAERARACDLVTVTGGFSFITKTTFARIIGAAAERDTSLPWIVGFPLLHTNLEPIAELLHEYGYVIQPDTSFRFRQRRFVTRRERESEHQAMKRAGHHGLDTEHFLARLFIAQPPGCDDVPLDVLSLAAGTNSQGSERARA